MKAESRQWRSAVGAEGGAPGSRQEGGWAHGSHTSTNSIGDKHARTGHWEALGNVHRPAGLASPSVQAVTAGRQLIPRLLKLLLRGHRLSPHGLRDGERAAR